MAELLAVVAQDGIRVARLVALLGHVISGATVAAGSSLDVGTVLGEVAHLIALATFDVVGGSRLGAFLGVMPFLLAVPADMGVDSLLGTVTGAVPFLLAVNTVDTWLDDFRLDSIHLAVLTGVAEL
jgi:hypothetical protein